MEPQAGTRVHRFYAVAFEENLSLRQVAAAFPEARATAHELRVPISQDGATGEMYVFPFGAVVTRAVPVDRREAELVRLRRAIPKLTTKVVREDYSVLEDPAAETGIVDGMLRIDQLTAERSSIVALTVAQSAAMEYYERIVDDLFQRTGNLVDLLERARHCPLSRATAPPLHRRGHLDASGGAFRPSSARQAGCRLGRSGDGPDLRRLARGVRSRRPLRRSERKLQSIQEALVLVLDVARDRRMLVLEVAIVVLIALEILLGFFRLG